jgi:hypothetical protein
LRSEGNTYNQLSRVNKTRAASAVFGSTPLMAA